MKGLFKNIFIISVSTAVLAAGIYCCYALYAATMIYVSLKQNHRGWYGRVHQHDYVLGFAPIPGARGAHIFPVGPPVSMRYGAAGFRVPVLEDIDVKKRPRFLFLGGSHTYGDACRAEDTFPWLVAKQFDATALNAGVCGYGLAQMLLLAQKLIPEYRPEVVVVEYADWLINRAIREFSPTYLTRIPYPYFTQHKGALALAPPVYRTSMFDTDISSYRSSRWSATEYATFMVKIALPLKLYDDAHYVLFLIKKLSGLVPLPADNKQEVCNYVYTEMDKLCRAYGSRMIVVGLKKQSYPLPPELTFINTEESLRRGAESKDDYEKAYAHWRGNPPVKVDNHPNPAAHRIIADQVIKKILDICYAE